MLNPELIKEFQLVIQKDYGKDVTVEEAGKILRDLVQYFSTLEKICCRMVTEKNDIMCKPDQA